MDQPYELMWTTLLQMAGQNNTIALNRVFVELTGSMELGALLGQLVYWTPRTKNPDGWVYKSTRQWQEELGAVTDYSIRLFKKLPYVETVVKRANGSPTTHYRINQQALCQAIMEHIQQTPQPQEETEPPEEPEETEEAQQIHLLNSTNPFGEFNESLTLTTTQNTGSDLPPGEPSKEFAELRDTFLNVSGMFGMQPQWIADLQEMVEVGITPEDMLAAAAWFKSKRLIIRSPESLFKSCLYQRDERLRSGTTPDKPNIDIKFDN